MSDQLLIMGRNTIEEVLKHAPQKLKQIFVLDTLEKEKRREALIELAQEKHIPISYTSKDHLNKMAGSISHQGFCALIHNRNYFSIEAFMEREENKDTSLVIALDHIQDPQNMGAIFRLVECFGASAVLWSKNRGCEITPTVTKASAGASELITLIRVANLANALQDLQKAGYTIILADLSEGAKSLFEYEFPLKSVIVLGSEGEGIQPLIKKIADETVMIPLKGKISSLNVSQAAAVFLSWAKKSIE
jgi:23S rRNA (guanosine2251-2'-O)-methyltransferase